jgi:hypothetical protein
MEIQVDAEGLEAAQKALDPKQVEVALLLWYARGLSYVKGELRSRSKPSLRPYVTSMTDGLHPPHWARVYVKGTRKGRLAHLLEGGTGTQGAGGFSHASWKFPSVTGVMRQTGLPQPEAFLVARAIFRRGGNPPQPFIRPTFEATQGRVTQLAVEAVEDALKGAQA